MQGAEGRVGPGWAEVPGVADGDRFKNHLQGDTGQGNEAGGKG